MRINLNGTVEIVLNDISLIEYEDFLDYVKKYADIKDVGYEHMQSNEPKKFITADYHGDMAHLQYIVHKPCVYSAKGTVKDYDGNKYVVSKRHDKCKIKPLEKNEIER